MANGSRPAEIPTLVDLRSIPDPTNRNNAITQSYHEFSLALTEYLGEPYLSNWFTYAKYASFSFGQRIRELTVGSETLVRVLAMPHRSELGPIRRLLGDLCNLPQAGKSFAPLIKLALTQANVPEELREEIACGRLHQLWHRFMGQIQSMWRAANNLQDSIERLQDGIVQGNAQIYESVTPAAQSFLESGSEASIPQIIGPADRNDFLPTAFALYAEVRNLAAQLVNLPDGSERQAMILRREECANRANLLIGFYEQFWVLQKHFDNMKDELRVITRNGSFEDPYGVHRVLPNGGDWVDIYQRMGMASDIGSQDPFSLTPANFPELFPPQDERRHGTIGEYFIDGLNRRLLDQPVPELLPIGMGIFPSSLPPPPPQTQP